MHCCSFDALLPEFASLDQLGYLGVIGPHHNLRDLHALLPLTWLRVCVHRHTEPKQALQHAFSPSFLD